ncbi:MAG: TetR/AcrR family transcriptional regulator [Ardenticatenales bacterium]|nr:TetR/AcrR family transcriptional regulator [Ardenticatenales bacterium]
MDNPKIEGSRRDELLQTAARLFREKGYHATTMKDIAAELEILPGSLYHHINSKQSLLVEIMTRGIQALLDYVEPVVASDESAAVKLSKLIGFHIQAITQHPDILTVFLHELKSLPPTERAEQLALRNRYEELLTQIIQQGQRSGEFRHQMHPRMTTFAILGMLNWLYAWYRADGSLSPEEIADEYVALVLKGVTA